MSRSKWCRGGELNSLRRPFQGRALPVSYPGTGAVKDSTGAMQGCQLGLDFFLAEVLDTYFIEASNSRIQSFPFKTSRGFVPSAGPTIPSFSMISIRRAALPYPMRRRRCKVEVEARP